MALSSVGGTDNRALEQNGKLLFRQDQLFHLHRLSLVLISATGQRLRFRTPSELEKFLHAAERSRDASVQRQLAAVKSVMPEEWGGQKTA